MVSNKKTKRIMITGGAGFIGSNLIARLKNSVDYEIIAVDNESVGSFSDISGWPIKCINSDIRDQFSMAKALCGVDTVIHLAGDTRVLDSIVDPQKNFDINVCGTFNLLRLARDAGVKSFISASTGGAIMGEITPPLHELMAPQPISPYGASKLAAEGYLSAFANSYGMRTVSLRFSNIYGQRSNNKGSVVAHFFKQILEGKEIVIFGDGSQVRDYLFVDDLTKGIQSVINGNQFGVFQLGSGVPTSLNKLIERMKSVIGKKHSVNVLYEPFRKGEVRATWCDISKAKKELGFDPKTQLDEGLQKTWDWFSDVLKKPLNKI